MTVAAPAAVIPDEDMMTRSVANAADTTANATPAAEERAPTVVAGYRLLRFIGAGGMGNVYEAEAQVSGTRVAVKLLTRKLSSNPASIERFKQEGRLASQISHPRCVFVLRADTEAGRPYIVMELMPGQTLKDLVDDRGPLPYEEAITRMLDVIDGLIEAHRLGVIHRDIKPSNCFLTDDDRVKIGDFGLSKSLAQNEENKQLTQSGAFLGTVLFAAPEQIRGEPVGYDTDVYAVCATLYYLLVGKAPHHHDSLTAALAKAISEPPPPIRERRSDVPSGLEKIVLRGLERDRDRRWQSLEELRDLLVEMLPTRQQPARPRAMTLAYLIDFLILQFVLIPVDILFFHQGRRVAGEGIQVELADSTWINLLITLVYFTLFEGWLGATPGKRLLKLRVCRLGHTGSPGLWPAFLRTALFNIIWSAMFFVPGVITGWIGGFLGFLLGMPFFFLSIFALGLQLSRSKNGYLGLHDRFAGTRVIQRLRAQDRIRLVSRFPSPLDRLTKPHLPLPAELGGFLIQGKICDTDLGGELWIGEDKSLGRRIVILVEPPGFVDGDFGDHGVVRPARLRSVGHGLIDWGGGNREWVAYTAPAGAPLPDLVSPLKPLDWSEARPILEQLVTELAAAEADQSLPRSLTPEQIWVEPGGRLQLLDVPLPTGQALAAGETKSRYPARSAEPLPFIRQVVTLMLEGVPRSSGAEVRAAIPPHASQIVNRLFTEKKPYNDIQKLQHDLCENAHHPAKVNTGLRATMLTLQGFFLVLGLFGMLVNSGFYYLSTAIGPSLRVQKGEQILTMLDSDQKRFTVLEETRKKYPESHTIRKSLESDLSSEELDRTRKLIEPRIAEYRKQVDQRLSRMNGPETYLFRKLNATFELDEDLPPSVVYEVIDGAKNRQPVVINDRMALLVHSINLAIFPFIIWPFFAFFFRGGVGMQLAGVTIVRSDGRKAGRFRCAFREVLGWLPFWVVLQTALWLQWIVPEMVFTRTMMWLLGLLILPISIAIAMRTPSRGPHDRLLGTHLMPI